MASIYEQIKKQFVTSDGEVFAEHTLAYEHQRKLQIEQDLSNLAYMKANNNLDPHALFEFLKANIERIVDIARL